MIKRRDWTKSLDVKIRARLEDELLDQVVEFTEDGALRSMALADDECQVLHGLEPGFHWGGPTSFTSAIARSTSLNGRQTSVTR
jgi:hypothetical protein